MMKRSISIDKYAYNSLRYLPTATKTPDCCCAVGTIWCQQLVQCLKYLFSNNKVLVSRERNDDDRLVYFVMKLVDVNSKVSFHPARISPAKEYVVGCGTRNDPLFYLRGIRWGAARTSCYIPALERLLKGILEPFYNDPPLLQSIKPS
jgi:hypothetical protein